MKFARWVFLTSGITGLLLMLPPAYAAAFGAPESLPNLASTGLFFYGFLFQFMCWQILYIFLAGDPLRHRRIMLPAFLAQVLAPFNTIWLYLYGLSAWIVIIAVLLALASLFLVSYHLTGRELQSAAA